MDAPATISQSSPSLDAMSRNDDPSSRQIRAFCQGRHQNISMDTKRKPLEAASWKPSFQLVASFTHGHKTSIKPCITAKAPIFDTVLQGSTTKADRRARPGGLSAKQIGHSGRDAPCIQNKVSAECTLPKTVHQSRLRLNARGGGAINRASRHAASGLRSGGPSVVQFTHGFSLWSKPRRIDFLPSIR